MGRRVEIEAEFPDAGIGLLVVREPPTRLAEHDHRDVQVSLTGRNARYAVAWHGAAGRSQRSPDAAPGLMVVPSGAPHQVDWTAEAGAVHLYLSPGLLAGVAVDRGLREGLNLRPTFNAVDPVLEGLARSFAAECRIGPPARAAMESLAYVVATRLVAGYAESARGLQGPPQGVLGGLALRRSIDYALSHLGEDVGVGEMARAAGVSPTHFITLFRRSTGLTPYRYLVRRRLDRARELIRTGRPLALIAVETGFHDQSHLTRRMRLEDGTTPAAYRQTMLCEGSSQRAQSVISL